MSLLLKRGFAWAAAQRFRRAILYVPGSDERKIKSAAKAAADCIVFDLEDSVTIGKKGMAREQVFQALASANFGTSELAVRINAIGSGLEFDDLSVVLRSKSLQSILIPKVSSASDITFVGNMIDSLVPEASRSNIRIMASIETAKGLLSIEEIAKADPRVDTLVFAAEDYVADLGLIRTPSRLEMLYARQRLVTVAVAHGLQSIDLVCVNFKEEDVLREECREGRTFGFTGKQAIHPAQVPVIHESFFPTAQEIEYATKIVEGYESHNKQGLGAFNLDGTMIDMPVVKWAERILAKAKLPRVTKS
ncbi:hypothetical protein HDU76_001539 [Blyttiomyces sp. JEL0837]|nr:hypothetical protein HDU76_001539 [Blyttiomyces sp. JEL0837]